MSPMVKDQNTKGILYIMTGMAFFSIQDSLIKLIWLELESNGFYQKMGLAHIHS